MRKRIVVCSDGTWNRPEKNPGEDFPTNVLKLARAIDEHREDFIPTIWSPRENMDLKQVWFAGVLVVGVKILFDQKRRSKYGNC